jgi:glycosyltransferase involved in cell wall biosynthesis
MAHTAVKQLVKKYDGTNKLHFVFLNTNNFMVGELKSSMVHFLPATSDDYDKARFFKTCDAMLHARLYGETFGLACGEFALENKPVITYSLSYERHHIEVLGDKGIYYTNPDEIYDILNNFSDYKKHDNYYEPYLRFSPEIIMEKFNSVYLN